MNSRIQVIGRILFLFVLLASIVSSPMPVRAAPAGYSEYYLPGSTDQLFQILKDIDNDPDLGNALGGGGTCVAAPCNRMHNVITVSISTDNVTVYYDHWENGYGTGSTGIDETYVVNKGDVLTFESANILVPRNAANTCTSTNLNGASTACYDGRDRIYVAGGAVSVAEAFWPEVTGTVYANAWEVYPVKPYQPNYTIPVGEDLSAPPLNYTDFNQVFVIAQATQDNTNIQIDNPAVAGVELNVTLNRGQTTQLFHVNAGTTVTGTAPVQVQFIVGQPNAGLNSDSRSYTAVPSSLWEFEYYSPVPSFGGSSNTDVFIYNPTASPLSINYQDNLGSGIFVLPAGTTRSYQALVGRFVPANSALHLSASDGVTHFWAIGSANTENSDYNYGYTLIPTTTLTREYYIGWAPGTTDLSANGSPVFVTPTVDNTVIFVDYSPNDGVIDATYTLNRIQMQRIFDPDNNNTGMHIWATNPIVVVWGEDADPAGTENPYIDAGYSILPLNQQWIDVVLTMDKSADPSVIASAIGQTSMFTLVTKTDTFGLQAVSVLDTLPPGWGYVAGSSIITLPNGATITGAAADPLVAGQNLTWNKFPASPLDMNGNETLTIKFQGITTSVPATDVFVNEATATGTNGTETFSASDRATVYVSDLVIDKVSSAGGTVNPSDPITYTVNIKNNGATPHNNLVVTDPLPIGTTYTPQSTTVTGFTSETTGDTFDAIAFTGNQDSNGATAPTWLGDWIEVGEADGAGTGDVQVLNNVSNYQLRIQNSNNGGEGVSRDVDLSACTNASLSLSYRRNALDVATDLVRLRIGASGTLTDTLTDFAGPNNDATYQTYGVDITNWISAQTRIQLLSSATLGAADQVFFDNVLITCYLPTIKDNIPAASNLDLVSGTPATLVTSADSFDLAPGATMVVSYQVLVDNPVPAGQTSVVNLVSVTSDEQPSPLQDTVTDVLPTLGAISGSVLADTNNDNIGDTPLAGVVLELLDASGNPIDSDPNTPGIQPTTTTTLADGSYSFANLPPGNYQVRETQPIGYSSVSDKDGGNLDLIGDSVLITVTAGATNTGNDFVEEQLGSIGGQVRYDVDNDGDLTDPDSGITAVTVELYTDPNGDGDPSDGILLTSVLTDASGNYIFNNLPPGNYVVVETNPTGYTSTADTSGANDDHVPVSLGAGQNSTGNDFLDTLIGAPQNLTKTLLDTNSNHTNGANVAVGEILTYQITVAIPTGVYPSLAIADTLNRGLAYVDCLSVDATGLTTDLQTGFTNICADTIVEHFPLASPDPADIDRHVIFNFGTITNSNAQNQTITIRYRAVVLDTTQNQDGASLSNSVQLTWGAAASLPPVLTTVKIVEPELSIKKTSDVAFIATGSEVTFTLVIQHTPNSHADALDVVIEDVLPSTLDFVSGSLDCTTGDQDPLAADCFYNPVTRTINAKWDTFILGGGVGQVRFRATGNASLPANTNVKNVGTVTWTSMPGDLSTPQSFTPNPFATERFYDPGDPVNIYGDSDSLTLTPLGSGGGGNNKPPTTSTALGGFLIPVTGFAPNTQTVLNPTNRQTYKSTNVTLEIPALKVDASIVGVKLQNGSWDVSWLQDQIGWLNGTAYPTWNGNSVLTGHAVNADGKPGIFNKLKYLKAGEYIFVNDSGYRYIYMVVSNKSIQPNDISVLKHEERSYITLITCDNFDIKSSTYLNRIVVHAVLVDVQAIN